MNWSSGARVFQALFLLVATSCADGGSNIQPEDRTAWSQWAHGFVDAVCNHEQACGVMTGAACVEVGYQTADKATCDAAVTFYLAHRNALEACTASYPAMCSLTPDTACPPTAGHSFESLCP